MITFIGVLRRLRFIFISKILEFVIISTYFTENFKPRGELWSVIMQYLKSKDNCQMEVFIVSGRNNKFVYIIVEG